MPRSYTITSGDTLDAIARKNGVSRAQLLQLNPSITDPNRIYAGRSLFLPDAPAASGTAAPTVPASDPYAASAKAAGTAGLSVNDTASLFGATPEEDRQQKDSLAQTFGYGTFDDFAKEVFSKPSKTTEQYYKEAYSAAGLDKIRANIEKRRADLAQAEFAINDNPWLSEASRNGRAGNLQQLANDEIANWENQYKLGLGEVQNLVGTYADDLGTDEKMKEARFNYLLKAAEEEASKRGTERLRTNLPSYLSGKQASEKPDTISVGEGNAVYQWDSQANAFKLLTSRPKTYAPKTTSATSSSGTSSTDKLVTAFRKSLANRVALTRAGNRDQFIRELQAQYPNIEPEDIKRAVMETYPNDK